MFGNLAVVGTGHVRAEEWLIDPGRMKVQAVTWTPDRSASTQNRARQNSTLEPFSTLVKYSRVAGSDQREGPETSEIRVSNSSRRASDQLVSRPQDTDDAGGPAIHLLVIDLPSAINIPRDPLLREGNELIDQHHPELVVGDFNAPRRSWALCELPAGYRHAYDTAGGGCGYTWPVPVPMYALDHSLHSPQVVPIRYGLFSSVHSDHRLQVFDFAWTARE